MSRFKGLEDLIGKEDIRPDQGEAEAQSESESRQG
jgi:hypothetical protein